MVNKKDESSLLQKRIEDLTYILSISKAMTAEKDIYKLLDLILLAATRVTQAERGSIFIVDSISNELRSYIARDSEIDEIRLPKGKGISGFVAETGEIVNIVEAYKDPRFNPDIDRITGFTTKSILCAPLKGIKGNIIGVVQLLNKNNDEGFDNYDIDILQLFCSQAAVSFENAFLYQENEKTFISFLRTLAKVIDARDPVTAGHSERVAIYARRIGKAMNLSSEDLKILDYAAALHDIGKIGIRDEILLKPSPFTEKEREIIKSHALITQDILEQMYFSAELRSIPHVASCHHERIDGKGYPHQLDGESISLLAKILAVADVYDALTSYDRPYKKAFSQQEAISILLEGRGTAFDAEVVDIFIIERLYIDEQRIFARIEKNIYIDYRQLVTTLSRNEIFDKARTLNISASGLLFETLNPIKIGRYIELTIHLPHYDFPIVAIVVRCFKHNNFYQIGIKFIDLSQEMEKRLEEYLVIIDN
ncbi:MAG: HD domain-containing protein [Candidatus Coatesbacteria bacterium]|nr:HD domain-containing protein [Candidatus Coatesbacteria bacterium]